MIFVYGRYFVTNTGLHFKATTLYVAIDFYSQTAATCLV